jgi:hypothetical protein
MLSRDGNILKSKRKITKEENVACCGKYGMLTHDTYCRLVNKIQRDRRA